MGTIMKKENTKKEKAKKSATPLSNKEMKAFRAGAYGDDRYPVRYA
jgi:hypothetical protein